MALAALDEGMPWVRARVAEAIENRDRLATSVEARGLAPLPSEANFVLVPVVRAGERARAMRALGVAVRPFDALPGVTAALRATGGSALRVSIGPWPMLEAMLAAFDATAEPAR